MVDDQRKYTAFLVGWLVVLVLLFCVYGNFEFKYGPNPNLLFINIPVNNWYIWSLLAVFLVCDKFVCSYVGNTQGAWITNTIYNEKQVEIMYSKFSCQIITTVFTGFYSFRAVFFIYLASTQSDFLVLRILTELLTTIYTTHIYLKDKKVIKTD